MWNKRKVSTSVPTRTFVTSHGHTASSRRVLRLRESIRKVIAFSCKGRIPTLECDGRIPRSQYILYHDLLHLVKGYVTLWYGAILLYQKGILL